jgi:high-affinity iron transporter
MPSPASRRPATGLISLLVLTLVAGAASALTPDEAFDVRRLLTLLAGVRDEYREAHDASGRLVRPIELDEARLLIDDARRSGDRLAAVVPPDLRVGIEALGTELASKPPADTLAASVDALRARLSEATGVAADAVPPDAPSAARGAALFADNCATCHGAQGSGDGPEVAALGIEPADFTDRDFMQAETPQDFFNVISLGRRGRGMPAWDEVLSVQDRWDLVAFVWTLHGQPGPAATATGTCAGCHLGAGDAVPDFATTLSLAQHSDADLLAALDSPAHAAGARLDDDAQRDEVALLRLASLQGGPDVAPGPNGRAGPTTRGLDEAGRLVRAAAEAARRGDPEAPGLATDAYIAFEPFERGLRVQHPAVVDRVEAAFVAFRLGLAGEGGDVDALAEQVRRELGVATALVRRGGDAHPAAVFAQAVTIILREGFEVILIVGALLTFVRRRQPGLTPAIRTGVFAGLAASAATAVVLVTLLRHLPWAGEAIEGGAMLVAAVVLFFVSYWLISKAEADRWQQYIQSRVSSAVGRGSGGALAVAAFLAVYREGFETLLFYQALLGTAADAWGMVVAGIGVGSVLLAGLWVLVSRIGMRVPMRPFFLGTGALLYLMSVVFAGRGVAELQEAGVIAITPWTSLPAVPTLGVFPTRETLLAQGVLVALLVYALVVTLRRRRTAVTAELAARARATETTPVAVGRNGHGVADPVVRPARPPGAEPPRPPQPRGNGRA